MRILILSKRQYLGKDLLDDRFFRNYEIPEALASAGHQVRGFALSYRHRPEGVIRPGVVDWLSFNAVPHLPRYLSSLQRTLIEFKPDIVWASSDVLHGIIAHRLCGGKKIPFVIDLYDNYDAFGLTKIPGLKMMFQRACRAADGLTVIGEALHDYVRKQYDVSRPVLVLGNAVRGDIFKPGNRPEARAQLNLPSAGRLIGTAGSLTRSRGIEILIQAFLQLAEERSDLWLVLAGPRDSSLQQFRHERIIDLGCLPLEHVPRLLASLDVGVVCNIDSPFGRYCFPQKLYEIAACGTPLLAADVGEAARILADTPKHLYKQGSLESLTNCLREQLATPIPAQLPIFNWGDRADELEIFLSDIVQKTRDNQARARRH